MISEEVKQEITDKAGFPMYVDYWEKYFVKLSPEQIKQILDIIFTFNKTCEIKQANDLAVEMVVTTIIDNIIRDAEKRLKKSKANKVNGQKGGRPKKEENKNPPKAKETKKTEEKPKKQKYGGFGNVSLTDEEFAKLKETYNNKTDNAIDILDNYIESSGKKYKSHFAVMKTNGWVYKEIYKKTGEKFVDPNYNYKQKQAPIKKAQEIENLLKGV